MDDVDSDLMIDVNNGYWWMMKNDDDDDNRLKITMDDSNDNEG